MKKIITKSKEETQKFAENFAKQILLAKSNLASNSGALIVGLIGDLGAGKTTFTQGFTKGLRIKQKIISPTFVILKKFKITNPEHSGQFPISHPTGYRAKGDNFQTNSPFSLTLQKADKSQILNYKQKVNYKNFIHIDAYRLENEKELLNLNWNELSKNPENIILIEWANKVKKILPQKCIKINFKSLNENKREIIISKF